MKYPDATRTPDNSFASVQVEGDISGFELNRRGMLDRKPSMLERSKSMIKRTRSGFVGGDDPFRGLCESPSHAVRGRSSGSPSPAACDLSTDIAQRPSEGACIQDAMIEERSLHLPVVGCASAVLPAPPSSDFVSAGRAAKLAGKNAYDVELVCDGLAESYEMEMEQSTGTGAWRATHIKAVGHASIAVDAMRNPKNIVGNTSSNNVEGSHPDLKVGLTMHEMTTSI